MVTTTMRACVCMCYVCVRVRVQAMAHTTITGVLALSCSLSQQQRAIARGDKSIMQQCHLGALQHFELPGKTIGLIGGLGAIGTRVGVLAQALGMEVLASSRTAPAGKRDDGVTVCSVDELLRESDFVSIHCPLNEETKGFLNDAALRKMKPSAFVVNTARGAIIDETALVAALREGRIAGAALDVYGEGSAPPPPLPDDSPLYAFENVVLTPHIGWQRLETRQRVVDSVAQSIEEYASGKIPAAAIV